MPLTGQAKKDNDAKYYLKNKKRIKQRSETWYKNNKQRALYIKKAHFARTKMQDVNMTADLVQKVYEDNIKKYGTLTCVLCLKRVLFGEDNLEHDVPLSMGGTHEYSNLGVSHRSCNSKKKKMTVKEYREKSSG